MPRTPAIAALRLVAAPIPLALILAALAPWPADANPLGRDRDPLLLRGASLPDLLGADPERIVAFRWSGTWQQIPVQVDERAVVDFGTIYDSSATGFTVLTYADTSTFTGPDPDVTFDADDELVLMGKDAGDPSGAPADPAGTIVGSGVELTITNPLTGAVAYAYLFESDGSLSPGAGESRVAYDFVLLSGDYKTTYNMSNGPNPEDSQVTTSAYAVHFADRWIRDETNVTAGGATGTDILDRHKNLYAPGNCGRSEDTFSDGEGAFIVNKEGPLRALRAYVGANSGPTTHRIHRFYESREDASTVLRVHPIPSMMDFFDYSPAASGMVYRNNLNLAGVTIDGAPDSVARGTLSWEMASGAQGTLVITGLVVTDIPGWSATSYYLDDATPPVTQCTGDPYAYGSSGMYRDAAIPNTDPALGAYYTLVGTRVIAYAGPGGTVAFAEDCAGQAANPLAATAAPYSPATVVADPSAGEAQRGEEPAFRLALAPNPVRASARFQVTLDAPAPVTLRIHDPAGRLVATLAETTCRGGVCEIEWVASRLPPGVYFVTGTVAGHRAMRVRAVVVR